MTKENNRWSHTKIFSLLFHFASLCVLIGCVYFIFILSRDLRRLEKLVREKNNFDTTDEPTKIRTRRASSDPVDSTKLNLSGSKLTILTKDDERLLLQTADGSPWALLPSLTRISLSTLEDFCFTTHQYCANKNQQLRTIANRPGTQGTDCDGRCSRRSNNDTPRDLDIQQIGDSDHSNDPIGSKAISATDPSSGRSNELYSVHPYDDDNDNYLSLTTPTTPVEDQTSSPTGKRRKGLGKKKRKRERCFIETIASPFLMGQRYTFYGSWMQDASPREDFDADKRWITEHVSGGFLFEYGSSIDLKRGGSHGDSPVTAHELPYMFDGTNHLMYNGTLIYQRAGFPVIVRYDLRTKNKTETKIQGAACNGGDFLYNPSDSHSYFDFAADENGLWVFFHYEKSKILSVARLHPKTMRLIRIWNLTRFDHTQIGDTWVTCGVMYVLDSTTQTNSRVSIAYDLFRHRSAQVNMPWRNTYNQTSMVTYNPQIKRLHIFDNGYLLERNLLIAYPGKQEGV